MSEHIFIVSLPFTKTADPTVTGQFSKLAQSLGSVGGAMREMLIPALKVGTLDSLMEASDDLTKLDPQLEGTVFKLAAAMEEISQKPRNAVALLRVTQTDEMTPENYLKKFSWNSAQFDTKEPIKVLLDKLAQVATVAEERIRSVITQFTDVRNRVQNATRKDQGNLSVRPIGEIVAKLRSKPLDTEFLITMFVAVPNSSQLEWESSYWKMNEFVCPQSAAIVAQDKEYTLNSVVLFKRCVEDFKLACRKKKYAIRDVDHSDDMSKEELDALKLKMGKDKASALTLLSQQYSLCYVAWIHVKAVRVFVESLLRYGLPPRFVTGLFAVDAKKEQEIRARLAQVFPDTRPHRDDTHHETNALQDYAYVSVKIANVLKVT